MKVPPYHKGPTCWLSGKRKEHILEEIIAIGLKKKKKKRPVPAVCTSKTKHSEIQRFCNRPSVPLHKGACYPAITL